MKTNVNMIKILVLVLTFGFWSSMSAQKSGATVKDADGNEYKTVVIGSQTWFAENLKTTKYANGTNIKQISDKNAWANDKVAGYCWYNNDEGNKSEYGALYNWYAINTANICPEGWHVATDADWNTLEKSVGGREKAAASLKEAGTSHWETSTEATTGDSGFNMLPGGFRDAYGNFTWQGVDAGYWTATGKTPSYAWNRTTFYYEDQLNRHEIQKCFGYSVRCVKN